MLSEQQQRIMGYFIEEAKDHLNTIEQGLLNLKATIEDPEMANEMFRAAHSVKGGAAMLGLTSIQHTAHRLEDYFKVLKECSIKIDQKLETLLLRVYDTLGELLEQLQGPFGLTDDKAEEAMAAVEPVFVELNRHLGELVIQAGAQPPEDVSLTAVPVIASQPEAVSEQLSQLTTEANALRFIFQNDVPARLREMLQLFKQADTAETRQQLQLLCQALAQLGEQLDLSAWCELLETASQTITNPENTYRTLAPVIIKDIKRAQEQILAGNFAGITASEDLLALLPEELPEFAESITDTDLAGLLGTDDSIDVDQVALFAVEEAAIEADEMVLADLPELSGDEIDAAEADLTFDFTQIASESDNADALDFSLSDQFDQAIPGSFDSQAGPEVGVAELNTLADLFEGDEPDLGLTWQEEIIDDTEDSPAESLELDAASDFSDLLFQNSSEELILEETDDLSDLLDSSMQESQEEKSSDAIMFDFSEADFGVAEQTNELLLDFNELDQPEQTIFFAMPLDSTSNPMADQPFESSEDLQNLDELFSGLEEAVPSSEPDHADIGVFDLDDSLASTDFESADATPSETSIPAFEEALFELSSEPGDMFDSLEPEAEIPPNELDLSDLGLESELGFDALELPEMPTSANSEAGFDFDADLADIELSTNNSPEETTDQAAQTPELDRFTLQEQLADPWTDTSEPSQAVSQFDNFASTPVESPFADATLDEEPFTLDLETENAEAADLGWIAADLPSESVSQSDAEALNDEFDDFTLDEITLDPLVDAVELDVLEQPNLELSADEAADLDLNFDQPVSNTEAADFNFEGRADDSEVDSSGLSFLNEAEMATEMPLGNLEFTGEEPLSDLELNLFADSESLAAEHEDITSAEVSTELDDLFTADLETEAAPEALAALNLDDFELPDDFAEDSAVISDITEASQDDLFNLSQTEEITTEEMDLGAELDNFSAAANAPNQPLSDAENPFAVEAPELELFEPEVPELENSTVFDFSEFDSSLFEVNSSDLDLNQPAIDPDLIQVPEISLSESSDFDLTLGQVEEVNAVNFSLDQIADDLGNADDAETSLDAMFASNEAQAGELTELDLSDAETVELESMADDLLAQNDSFAAAFSNEETTEFDWTEPELGQIESVDLEGLSDDGLNFDLDLNDFEADNSEALSDLNLELVDLDIESETPSAIGLSGEESLDLDLSSALEEVDTNSAFAASFDTEDSIDLDLGFAPSETESNEADLDLFNLGLGESTSESDATNLSSEDTIDLDLGLSDLDMAVFGNESVNSNPTDLNSFFDAEPSLMSDEMPIDASESIEADFDTLLLENTSDSESLPDDLENLDFTLPETDLIETELVSAEPAAFDDLQAALAEDLPSVTAVHEDEDVEAESADDFADLEALLEDAPPVTEVPTAAEIVSAPVFEEDEFSDLEALLQDADQSLGVGSSPTRKSSATTNRRPSRRSGLNDQTMRVTVKHLDNLNNLVGEMVVNRNSLEQAQERLRQFLDNLLYQVQQLSDVGQRMRDLYERSLLESSLLSSRRGHSTTPTNSFSASQTSHGTGANFDALEMDRFTGFHVLSQEMIELIVRVRESASDIDFVVEETDQVTRNFRQITTQLQEGLTRSRMVPFAQTADRLPRGVRDNSLKYGKQAELVIEGRDTLIDKMIVELLYDPMTHLVNNAIAHGIETPEERIAAGKSPTGRITIRAFHQGNQTVISVSDDGAGINPEGVRAKALAKGLITPTQAREMSRLDTYDLLFRHGFSTADQVDDLRGRGVGLDVVRNNLNEIRGTISIDSVIGKGTTFTVRLPLTLSISKALCCISNRARIAFPMDGVEDMLDVPRERIQMDEQGRQCIQWRDLLLPFQHLSELLRYNRVLGRGSVYGGNQEEDLISIVVLRSAGNFLALQVDQVLGEQEIVIKQLEGPVPKPLGVAGATVLGDGRIMPIADVLELIDLWQGRVRRDSSSLLWDMGEAQLPLEPLTKTEPTVLIVDDSITVRELLSMTFSKVGYRVEQARDGQEAWEKLRSGLPCDLVFCDIEMPRMDGLELLSRIQKDTNLNHLPIAMLTSRGADRHRQMAVQLGAKGYFTKPYLEEVLLDAAQRMLKGEVMLTSTNTQ